MLKTPPWLHGDYSSRGEPTREGWVAPASVHRHWMIMWMFVSRDVIKTVMKTAGENDLNCSCCSVTQSCPTLCDPMDYRMPGFPVLHCLPEFAPLSQGCHSTISSSVTLSPPALNLSQHQGLFQWVRSLHHGQSIGASASASVLPTNIQG